MWRHLRAFLSWRKVLSDEEARLIEVHPKYYNDTSDAALMTSRGGLLYQRFHLEALLRPGIGANNWVSRSNYPVLGWCRLLLMRCRFTPIRTTDNRRLICIVMFFDWMA